MDERTGEINQRGASDYDDDARLANDTGYINADQPLFQARGDITGVDMTGDMTRGDMNDSYTTGGDMTGDMVGNDDTNVDIVEDDHTQAIREEIEHTRSDLAETINAIQERLNPQTLVEQAKETAKNTAEDAIDNAKQAVHDATIGKVENMVSNVSDSVHETSSGLMGLVKSNPVPAALAGLGLGWLYMKRNAAKPASYVPPASSSGQYGYYPQPASYRAPEPTYRPAAPVSGQYYGGSSSSSGNKPNSLLDSVKQNPVPAALAGLSIGYILMQGQNQSHSSSNYQPYSYPVGNAARNMRQGSESLGDKAGNLVSGVGDKVGNVAGTAGDVVGNVAGTAGDVVGNVAGTAGDVVGTVASGIGTVASGAAGAVGTVAGGAVGAVGTVAGGLGDAVGNVASGAGDVVGNVTEGVGYQAERVTNSLERLFNDKPLVVGALAVGAGAFIGLLLPETQQEKQLLGEARDTLVGKVQDVASQTMDKVSQVTDEVQNTVKREAENTGLINPDPSTASKF